MLPVVEKGIRGGKYHAGYWHAKSSNKYMKDNDQNIESSYLMNQDINNLYKKANRQNLLRFMQAQDDNSIKEYILEVDVSFPKQLQKIQSDLPILPERMKIEKYQKVVCNMYDKTNYAIHIKAVKQTLNSIKKHG